ncbi:MAG TPA: hypothetical protein VGK34_07250 [Armatimonadota bacterium]
MRYLVLVTAVVLMFATLPAFGAANYLGGMSGNIFTPDDVIEPTRDWEISYHNALNLLGDDDLQATGIQYGLFSNLEVGVSFIADGGTNTAFNAKYRLVPETSSVPNVTVGVFDLLADSTRDTNAFILVSKNITPFATRVTDTPSKPLRAELGFGTGIYKSVFAALNWTYSPKWSAMAEYVPGDIGDRGSTVNLGVRYAATNSVRVDAAVIDFHDFAFGASFRSNFK